MGDTVGAVALGAVIAAWGVFAGPWFALLAAIGCGVGAVVVTFPDVREVDGPVDGIFGGILERFAGLFTLARSAAAGEAPAAEAPTKCGKVRLGVRLALLLAAGGFVGLVVGLNSGAAASGLAQGWQKQQLFFWVLGGGGAAAAGAFLAGARSFAVRLLWLVGGGALGVGSADAAPLAGIVYQTGTSTRRTVPSS